MSELRPQDYWLVRDSKNLIWGPVPREELLKLVRDGKLKNKTEVAHSLSYWFSLEEKQELLKFFPELADQFDSPEEPEHTHGNIVEDTKTVPGEWLSDEYAEEFGYIVEKNSDGTTVARRKDEGKEPTVNFDPSFQDDEPTFVPAMEAATDPTLAGPEIEELQQRMKRRNTFIIIGVVLIIAILGAFVVESVLENQQVGDEPIQIKVESGKEKIDAVVSRLKVALLLSDLSKLNEEITELTTRLEKSDQPQDEAFMIPLSRAIMKREFLYDSGGAISILKRILATQKLSKNQAAEIQNLLGIYLLDSDPEKSIVNFSSALEARETDATIKYNFALSLIAGGRRGDAIKALNLINEELLEKDPIKPYVLQTLGRETRGKVSIRHLNEALELNSELDEARLLLAIRYLERGASDEANLHFVRFIDYLPGYLKSQRVRNFRLAHLEPVYGEARSQIRKIIAGKDQANAILLSVDGVLSTNLGEFTEAEQAFRRALSILPGSIDALKGLAFMRLKDGKEFEIENIIKAKTEANPTNFALNALLGLSFLRQGKAADAAKNFKRLSSHHGEISSSWTWLGQSAMELGNKEKGVEYFEKALSVNSRDITALDGLAKAGAGNKVKTQDLIKLLPF